MGSGKSMIGKKLAASLNLSFFDIDLAFESQYKITIDQFFRKYGEVVFRNLESRILHQTADLDNVVISTGGGTPCFHNNMEFITRNGISIYLKVSPETIRKRLSGSIKPRPLLMNLPPDQLPGEIEKLLKIREPFYTRASFTLESDSINLQAIIAALQESGII